MVDQSRAQVGFKSRYWPHCDFSSISSFLFQKLKLHTMQWKDINFGILYKVYKYNGVKKLKRK